MHVALHLPAQTQMTTQILTADHKLIEKPPSHLIHTQMTGPQHSLFPSFFFFLN